MTRRWHRRGALRVIAAGLGLPLAALGLRVARGDPRPVRWQGEVLGAWSGMTLWHPNPAHARRAISRMLAEIDRLERVFSLYRPDSQITRLNRDGQLDRPAADLVSVLDHSLQMAALSAGAFDPTVQPLWLAHSAGPADPARIGRARALVDHAALSVGAGRIRLGRPGMAITLNGIAQGHITDRITDLLGNEGFETAMIELGETRALGTGPDGRPFSIGLVDPLAPDRLGRDLSLAGAALAVSGGYGLRFDGGGHHILDPRSGASAQGLAQVAVTSARAVWADALSTAIHVAGTGAAGPLLAAYPGSQAILWHTDGTVTDL